MTSDSAAKVIFVPGGDRDATEIPSVGVTKKPSSNAHAPTAGSSQNSYGPGLVEAPIQREGVGPVQPVAATGEQGSGTPALFSLSAAGLHPIVIWVTDPTMRNYLELPARPGDLLILPAAGQVTVGGWVQNPGGFSISSGMTALSAISAAGGPLFSTTGVVLRTTGSQQRSITPFSISRIKSGEEADIPVQSGDVVMVNRSVLGAGPYFVYTLFSKFGTGVAVPIP
jgi:hypothetical protein